ncbi:hypothetical protein CLV76_13223 [Marivita geojedonensis]|nr:hypothetical protein CLV76_13223 [Marivita geojedonensis]
MHKISGTYLGQGTACPLFQMDDCERVTLTGRMPNMEPGEKLELEGNWMHCSTCMQGGRTFKVSKYRRANEMPVYSGAGENSFWPSLSGLSL